MEQLFDEIVWLRAAYYVIPPTLTHSLTTAAIRLKCDRRENINVIEREWVLL